MRLFTIYVASFYFACSRGNYLTLLSATALIANTSYMLPNFIVLLSYCIDIIVFLQQRQLFDTALWCTWGGCCPHCQPFTYCLILLLYCYLIALILLYFCTEARIQNFSPLQLKGCCPQCQPYMLPNFIVIVIDIVVFLHYCLQQRLNYALRCSWEVVALIANTSHTYVASIYIVIFINIFCTIVCNRATMLSTAVERLLPSNSSTLLSPLLLSLPQEITIANL